MDSELTYLGLGSNLGDKLGYLRRACHELKKYPIIIEKEASFYTTPPVGPPDQPEFLNTIIAIRTDLLPHDLLGVIKEIERKMGRKKRQHWGPREIDIDIIIHRDTIINSTRLIIPHREMDTREFVLLPLAEIAPNLRHPLSGKTIKELLEYYYENLQRDSRGARLFKPTET